MRIVLSVLAATSVLLHSQTLPADTFQEDFASEPAARGWRAVGDTNLFFWNRTNQNLEVTWDSSKTNSYFCHPLGTVLAVSDVFSLEFDLQLRDVQYTGTFELAVGLFNLSTATGPDFSRATGDSPNLFEFDYFPDADGAGHPNIAGTMTDMAVGTTNASGFYFIWDPQPMQLGITYHVQVIHNGNNPPIQVNVLTNGQLYTSVPFSYPGPIYDVRLDTVGILSYSAAGDTYGDSILAQGTIDNIKVTMPPPPVAQLRGAFDNGAWEVQFVSQTNWLYSLERTLDFQTWTATTAATPGTGALLPLQDSHAPAGNAYYRVKASRP